MAKKVAPDLNEFVAQRGTKDCVVASVATAIDSTYEAVAANLGLELDPVTRAAKVPPDGVDILSLGYPLLRMGWSSTPMVAREHPQIAGHQRPHPSSDELKEVLRGRRAIVGYTDPTIGPHSIAWNGSEAIDCGDGTYVDLDEITVTDCTVLVKEISGD